jgi:hypothetical protein
VVSRGIVVQEQDPLGDVPHVQILMNDGPPTRPREMLSCSAIDLAEIRQSSKIPSDDIGK